MVYIGEGTETVDAVEYKVKKYAQLVIDDNPYFYTYYKLYFLNGKLRRLYSFNHGIGCEMDYKYDEFVEHQCGQSDLSSKINNTYLPKLPNIYTYYENGKVESHIDGYMGGSILKYVYEYYSGGMLKVYKTYFCPITSDLNAASWTLNSIKTYNENGKAESSITYAADGVTEASEKLYTYYSNGNKKTEESYTNGLPTNKYTYYESGNEKTSEYYSYGIKSSLNMYFDESSQREKLWASFNSNRASRGKVGGAVERVAQRRPQDKKIKRLPSNPQPRNPALWPGR